MFSALTIYPALSADNFKYRPPTTASQQLVTRVRSFVNLYQDFLTLLKIRYALMIGRFWPGGCPPPDVLYPPSLLQPPETPDVEPEIITGLWKKPA
jgi:hypothetical protein